MSAVEPGGHEVHAADDGKAIIPSGQLLHDDEPDDGEYVPAAHE